MIFSINGARRTKDAPQGLQPKLIRASYGIRSASLRTGSEAVPLSKTNAVPAGKSASEKLRKVSFDLYA
jgi:hypothetical protein